MLWEWSQCAANTNWFWDLNPPFMNTSMSVSLQTPCESSGNSVALQWSLIMCNCWGVYLYMSCFSPASLDNTTAWLQAAASEEASAVTAQSDSPSPDSRGPVSATAVLNRAYMRLLHWDPQDQKYPEVRSCLQNYITSTPAFIWVIFYWLSGNLQSPYTLLLTLLHVKASDNTLELM